jgi:hypothetical protein
MTVLAFAAAAIAALGSPGDPVAALEGRTVELGGICYRITALDVGPGQRPYAWLVAVEMPRGVRHDPLAIVDQAPPCSTR